MPIRSQGFLRLSTLPDNAVRNCNLGELQKYNVIRVADEILVDLMRSAAVSIMPKQPERCNPRPWMVYRFPLHLRNCCGG